MSLLSIDAGADVVVSYRMPYWQTATLTILAGPLSGARWLPMSGGKVLRMICGTYERAQSLAFQQCVTADSVVLDVGANVGYYSLLSSKLASDIFFGGPQLAQAREHLLWRGDRRIHDELLQLHVQSVKKLLRLMEQLPPLVAPQRGRNRLR